MNNPDHTLNRISLVGIGGGLALIATLYYPLYVLLPSQYLADWQTGSPLLAVILLLLSPFLVVGTGYLAARQVYGTTRTSNLFWGPLASAIAGAIFFYGLGGAAAGVVGSRTDPPALPVDFTLADHVHYLYMAHGITLFLLSARVVRLAFVLSAILVGVSILAVKLFEGRSRWQTKR